MFLSQVSPVDIAFCVIVAGASGGAIYVIGNLQLNDSRFVGNTAVELGTAIASVAEISLVEFARVAFQGNSLRCPLGEYGYGVFNEVRNVGAAVTNETYDRWGSHVFATKNRSLAEGATQYLAQIRPKYHVLAQRKYTLPRPCTSQNRPTQPL